MKQMKHVLQHVGSETITKCYSENHIASYIYFDSWMTDLYCEIVRVMLLVEMNNECLISQYIDFFHVWILETGDPCLSVLMQ